MATLRIRPVAAFLAVVLLMAMAASGYVIGKHAAQRDDARDVSAA